MAGEATGVGTVAEPPMGCWGLGASLVSLSTAATQSHPRSVSVFLC